jgi:predicted alpha-1,2-mannosidase
VWRLDKKRDNEPCLVEWAEITVNGSQIKGGRSTNAWAKGRELYFTMECSVPPNKVEIFADGVRVTDSRKPVRGARLYAVLSFDHQPGAQIELKTAISGVSVEGSVKNLATELPDWDFDHVRAAANERWENELSRVMVAEGGTPHTLSMFYTSLYHALLAPTLFDDVDGSYRGMDGSVHVNPAGMHNYSTYSLWDTYRALHPMLTLVMPERVSDIVGCIVRQSTESPQGVTVWPLQGKETGCMVGYHSAPVVAEALRKGFKGIDAQAAYEAFQKRADVDDYRGLAAYRHYGYVPCDFQNESGSKTCDYAYDDWCVAAIADAAGQREEAVRLRVRSLSYRNLFDHESGFIRPRFADGHWAAPFNPKSITVTHRWRDYTEANAWQTTFLVQHDADGLCTLLGGERELEKKLDALFNQSSDMPTEMMPPDITGMVGQYCQGNEPSHHIVYYYNTAGAPAKTQQRIHQLMTDLYHPEPDAMAGNEDCGQMSAWYCMNAFGFYPVDPTSTDYSIGTPLFDRMRLRVGDKKNLEIHARRQSPQSIYVRSVAFNGRPVLDYKLHHAELAQGGLLEFELADEPK